MLRGSDALKTIRVDANLHNADWIRQGWPFAPYKSKEFMKMLERMEMTLEHFKTLPIYKRAVEQGKIVDDKWKGG